MVTPKADFGSPLACIRWTLAAVLATGEPATLRDAKRLLRPRRDTGLEFESVLNELWQAGEVRQFRDPARVGKPGRPTAYLHPRTSYRYVMSDDLRVTPRPTTESAPLAPHYQELKELLYVPPAPESAPPESEAEIEPELTTSLPNPSTAESPPPDPQPDPPNMTDDAEQPEDGSWKCEWCGADLEGSMESPRCPNRGCNTNAEPVPPEPTTGTETPDAFAAMRALAAKSLRERGYGVTDEELLWLAKKREFPDPEALVTRFTTGPEHYLQGGLYRTEPSSPHNKTPQPRYIPRTDGQAKSLEDARFEVERQAKLRGQPPTDG